MKRRGLLVGLAATLGGAARTTAQRAAGPPIEGRLRAGELLAISLRPAARVDFDEEAALPITSRGRVLFAAAHDTPGPHSLTIDDGRRRLHALSLAARPYPRRDARVPALPLSDMHDHAQTLEGLSRVRRRVSARAWFERGVAWPLDGEVTSEFGASRAHGVHLGIDLRAPIATEVRAPADGVVVMLVETAIFGRTVVIDHGHGLTSSLLHLSRALAHQDTHVRRGDVVALSGATGRVTGPHLDWRVAWRDVDVDPRGVLALLPAR